LNVFLSSHWSDKSKYKYIQGLFQLIIYKVLKRRRFRKKSWDNSNRGQLFWFEQRPTVLIRTEANRFDLWRELRIIIRILTMSYRLNYFLLISCDGRTRKG